MGWHLGCFSCLKRPTLARRTRLRCTDRSGVGFPRCAMASHRVRGALGLLYRPGPFRGFPPAVPAVQQGQHYSPSKMCQRARSERVFARFVRRKRQKPGYLALICPIRESKPASKIFPRFCVCAGQKPKKIFQLALRRGFHVPTRVRIACVCFL